MTTAEILAMVTGILIGAVIVQGYIIETRIPKRGCDSEALQRIRRAFGPVRHRYDHEGKRDDLAAMIGDAVSDLLKGKGKKK